MNFDTISSTPSPWITQYTTPTAQGKSKEPTSKDKAKVIAGKIIKKKDSFLSQHSSRITAASIKKNKTHILTQSTKQNKAIETVREEKVDIAMYLSQFTPPNVDGINKNGWTPLTYAIAKNNLEIVKLLVQEFKADVRGVSENGWTPLNYAVAKENLEMIRLLIKELKADVNEIDRLKWTPLTYAIAEGKLKVVKLLVEELGADVNGIDKSGWTPLTYAVSEGKLEIVKLLVNEFKVDINGIDEEGWAPWVYAVEEKDLAMLKLLKDLGAEENMETLERKFLASVWGIKGSFELNLGKTDKTIQVKYEGLPSDYSMKMLREYVHTFFDNAKSSSISKEIKEQILNAIDQGFPLSGNSPAEMAAIVKKGKSLIITTGTEEHAVSVVLFKEKLAICNRGEGRKANAVEFYSLPSDKITGKIIKQLTELYPGIKSFNQMIANLNLTHLGGYYQKSQKVGNCAWASPKAAVGALFYLYFGEQIGRQLYKEFTGFAREYGLRKYRQKSTTPDTKLLQAIEEKKENKAQKRR